MGIKSELREIKRNIIEISKKLDEIITEKETVSLMMLSEKSLQFLKDEPDVYTVKDLKVRYDER